MPYRLRFKPPPPPASGPVCDLLSGRTASVGGGSVRRVLPHPKRRLVGAWCFADHFGPSRSAGDVPGQGVGPHPHIGLQTVTWLLAGRTRHRDSLGTNQVIASGQLNWMTAGRGIAHAEDGENSPGDIVHGVQLWVALPEAHRHGAPAFEHIPDPPQVQTGGATVTLLAGSLLGETCPATTFSPLLGADLALPGGASALTLPLQPDFEHAVMVLEGTVTVEGRPVTPNHLLYLGTRRSALTLQGPGRALLLGGAPLQEPVAMWWNFVFRDPDEAAAAAQAWNDAD